MIFLLLIRYPAAQYQITDPTVCEISSNRFYRHPDTLFFHYIKYQVIKNRPEEINDFFQICFLCPTAFYMCGKYYSEHSFAKCHIFRNELFPNYHILGDELYFPGAYAPSILIDFKKALRTQCVRSGFLPPS